MTPTGMRWPPMWKFCRLRWVWAPHSMSAGTSIGPMESVSLRVAGFFAIINLLGQNDMMAPF